ncbi:hypothetical protein [Xanthomonas cannabis]|uniref:Uncharacterized protein n=1 Tax=Xanthomonas cannabis TaxID=1885674 RepID=A0ABR6JGR5_9XANT|nr:hypothetical protein [Xanthomonas cannabis]MBB4591997.1 hypothetical protein [Xanthomonas cannabis]MBB5522022.1 hypothetical protein [Xanthomonas cannabis]
MEESGQEHDKRHSTSRLLTRLINDAEQYPHVRSAVIETLVQLDKRIAHLNNFENEFIAYKQILNSGPRFVRMHLKGDNALDACLSKDTDPLQTGTSVWDIQVLANPWLPARAQEEFYTHIKRIVFEEIDAARTKIAIALYQDIQIQLPLDESEASSHLLERQSIIFFDEKSGLVDEKTIICDEAEEAKELANPHSLEVNNKIHYQKEIISQLNYHDNQGKEDEGPEGPEGQRIEPSTSPHPSIVINSNIETTIEYHLAYKWHFESDAPEAIGMDFQKKKTGSHRKITTTDKEFADQVLMKIINITVLRPDKIETMIAWSDFERDELSIDSPQLMGATLPSIYYHLRETLFSLCKIADGSSLHTDERDTCKNKFNAIYRLAFKYPTDSSNPEQDPEEHKYQKRFNMVFNAVAGRTLALKHEDPDRLVKGLIELIDARRIYLTPSQISADGLWGVQNAALQSIMQSREKLKSLIRLLHRTAFPELPPLSAAFSDDLALIDSLKNHPYINVQQFPFSGVDMAALVRIPHNKQVAFDFNNFLRSLDARSHIRIHQHNTLREGNISYETTLALLIENTVIALITLTSAHQNELPFVPIWEGAEVCNAPLLDMHEQRKTAIALTEDYVLRNRMTQQHKLIQYALSKHSH